MKLSTLEVPGTLRRRGGGAGVRESGKNVGGNKKKHIKHIEARQCGRGLCSRRRQVIAASPLWGSTVLG